MTARIQQHAANQFEFEEGLTGTRVQRIYDPRGVHYHFHAEFELLFARGVSGHRIVGDSVDDFKESDLILTGPQLAHGWMFDPALPQGRERARVDVVTFTRQSLGIELLEKPELSGVARLLSRSERGVAFGRQAVAAVEGDIDALLDLPPGRRLLSFLLVLDALTTHGELRSIVSDSFVLPRAARDHAAFAAVLAFIHERSADRVTLGQIAEVVHMSVPTFTRFFRRMTGSTFVEYLNEWRVMRACALLRGTRERVVDISVEVGFRNLSHFNRCFLKSRGITPSAYRASRSI